LKGHHSNKSLKVHVKKGYQNPQKKITMRKNSKKEETTQGKKRATARGNNPPFFAKEKLIP